ncbi:MAG: hypothetical protein A2Y73_04255 [Chloroflexi bacterium RBG_13_56_8]|nr:MAG: hypothetical protein A2Y73_04255 [Chloroflexi bacterium RBG_13_56_8]
MGVFKRGRALIVTIIVVAIILANFFSPFRIEQISIRLASESIFQVGSLTVTNTLLCSWLAMLLLVLFGLLTTRKLVDVPKPLSIQNVTETIFELLYRFVQNFAGSRTRALFPVVATFFLYILTSNWIGLLPGFGSIGFWEVHEGERAFIPLLRGPTSDLNTTIALALCSVISAQVYGIRFRGFYQYSSRFVPVKKLVAFFRAPFRGEKASVRLLLGGILDLFIGLLEIFEELTKILSFSFRLFGNIFGGEVLLIVIAFLAPYVASIPFLALEIGTGLIQAFIFSVLTAAFLSRAIAMGHAEIEEDEETGIPLLLGGSQASERSL